MNLIKKLAIPAIILTIFYGNICMGSEAWVENLDPSLPKANEIRQVDFLPHTFWQQTPEEIVSYLKPQILETRAFDYYSYFIRHCPNYNEVPKPWRNEEFFKEIVYDKISEFMKGKAEPMPSLEKFKASFNKRIAHASFFCGYSNLMSWLGKYLLPFAIEAEKESEEYRSNPSWRKYLDRLEKEHLDKRGLDKE